MLDVDGIGYLCDPCGYRGCPPHCEFLTNLFARKHLAPEDLDVIASFAYPVVSEFDAAVATAAASAAGLMNVRVTQH